MGHVAAQLVEPILGVPGRADTYAAGAGTERRCFRPDRLREPIGPLSPTVSCAIMRFTLAALHRAARHLPVTRSRAPSVAHGGTTPPCSRQVPRSPQSP